MTSLDMLGVAVNVGDVLADQRGKTFVVETTEPSFLREGLVKVHATKTRGGHTYLRLAFVFVLNDESSRLDQDGLRQLWQRLYDQHIRQANVEALRSRKGNITGPANHIGRITSQ